MPDDVFGFDGRSVRKISRTVGIVLDGVDSNPPGLARFRSGRQCIDAKILAQDGTDKSKFSWQQEIRDSTGGAWIVPTDGLKGTTSSNSAYQLDPDATTDLSGQHVILVLMPVSFSDGVAPGWIIVGAAGNIAYIPVTKDGGSSGDSGTPCSYTYTFTVGGTTYAHVAITGRGKRNDVGAMTEGHYAAIQFEAGVPKIYWVDESLNFSGCSTSDIIGGF